MKGILDLKRMSRMSNILKKTFSSFNWDKTFQERILLEQPVTSQSDSDATQTGDVICSIIWRHKQPVNQHKPVMLQQLVTPLISFYIIISLWC